METALWTSSSLDSAEYFTLGSQDDGFRLDGTINLLLQDRPTQVVYHIDCDIHWITRRVEMQQRQPDGERRLLLTVDEALNWFQDGIPLPWAAGLTDVDLSITPATNLLAMRKHKLQIGDSCEVNAMWVQFPTLTLATLPQCYTRIDSNRYRYAAPSLDFEAVLTVDGKGFIVQYGDLWSQPRLKHSSH